MNEIRTHQQHFKNSLFIAGLLAFIIVLIFVVEQLLGVKFDFLGVFPRKVHYLQGIITHVFVHADSNHLLNNVLSFFILTLSLFYFYGKIADKVLLFGWVFTGLLLWTIGRDSLHIGASGLIYAQAFFLFWSGVIRKYAPLIAIALIVVFFYGIMVWHVFPWQAFPNESWEGHLSGAIVGSLLAVLYRKQGPQRPVKEWHEEQESEDEKNLAEYAESFELEGEEQKENVEDSKENEKKEGSNGFRSSELY
jgi:membrane associated rhomboid family serine protease